MNLRKVLPIFVSVIALLLFLTVVLYISPQSVVEREETTTTAVINITVDDNNYTTAIGKRVSISGVVVLRDSCWFVETERPALFLPINMPLELQSEGLRVSIEGEIVDRPQGVCKIGIPIRIITFSNP